MLSTCTILLGITGSIAAYKSVDLTRRLIEQGASVQVVMTESACRFITPYAFESVTGNKVCTDLFGDPFSHIRLPQEASLFVIAPATANSISKLSCGIADNLLTCAWLAYEGPAVIAPAMNFRMYRNAAVQSHIQKLAKSGVQIAGPVSGALACGEEGEGRMIEAAGIIESIHSALTPKDLKGEKILVTAGPTVEPLDPVRFLSNRSSGKQGYAIAQAAVRRGADVSLISGPTSLMPPEGAAVTSVETAAEMEGEVLKQVKKSTALVMAAAVSDYAPDEVHKGKVKKQKGRTLQLRLNNDILEAVTSRKGKKVVIGFAAQTCHDVTKAADKLKKKKLDLIVMNNIAEEGAGFNTDTNIVTLIDKKGAVSEYPLMQKADVANIILDRLVEMRRAES